MSNIKRQPFELSVDSDSALNHLIEGAKGNQQRLRSIENLRKACQSLASKGSRFTLKDIEKYCAENFNSGPKAQTIANDKLLRAFVDIFQLTVTTNSRRRNASLESDIAAIDDPDLRARLYFLADRKKGLESQNRMIVQALSKLNPPISVDQLIGIAPKPHLPATSPLANPKYEEAVAGLLSKLLDQNQMMRFGLSNQRGHIIAGALRETLIPFNDVSLLSSLLTELLHINDPPPKSMG